MGKALYREYRPRALKDVAGQPHITRALEQSLKSGVVSHAYLFTGPRGVGKTSVARILAYQVNDLPYDETTHHLDIIEIDAASNRGIEDVRELRDKVAVSPTSAKYKVYIIDEVHMLTTPAFNALLKTLEEPPAHVIFILATTEAHKLPQTIISRTQHYAFRPISTDSIVNHLRAIAKSEDISIQDDALEILATHGGGSFRDSIGLLDQVRHSGEEITPEEVRSIFGIAPANVVATILRAIAEHNTSEVYSALTEIREQGITASSLATQIAFVLRNDIKNNSSTLSRQQGLVLLRQLIDVAPSPNPEISLEVILIGASLLDGEDTVIQKMAVKPAPDIPQKVEKPQVDNAEVAPKIKQHIQKKSIAQEKKVEAPAIFAVPKDTAFDVVWQEALQAIKKTHHSLYGVLRMSDAGLDSGKVILHFRFKLHYDKVNDPVNREIVAGVLKQLTNTEHSISCSISETSDPKQNTQATQTEALPVRDTETGALSTISNIFGGGELLES